MRELVGKGGVGKDGVGEPRIIRIFRLQRSSAVSWKVKNLTWFLVCCKQSLRNTDQQDRSPLVEAIVRKVLKSLSGLYIDLERSKTFRKCLKALKKLLLIDNVSIYICTMGRFQRMLHFQVTINFVYEILKHFKASCKGSEKHSSRI